jgi:hypothetical protein
VLNDEENMPPISQHPHTCVELHRVLINCHAVTSSTVVGWEGLQSCSWLWHASGRGYRSVALALLVVPPLPRAHILRGRATRNNHSLALSLNSTQLNTLLRTDNTSTPLRPIPTHTLVQLCFNRFDRPHVSQCHTLPSQQATGSTMAVHSTV